MEKLTLETAVSTLLKGGIIAYPTETFYGLGGIATFPEVAEKIFRVKERNRHSPISILISELSELEKYVENIPEEAELLIQKYWPGALTLVFKVKPNIFPSELLSNGETVAIRVSSHPIARELCRKTGFPLTTTSANLSGFPSARTAQEVENYFGKKIDGIIDGGELAESKGSTILDITSTPPKVLRKGEILYTP